MAEQVRVSHSGSESRQRQRIIAMRCTEAESAQLEAAAERAGMSLSSYMRQRCLGTAGPRAARRPPVERAALAQVLAQLGKCGSNLNQIARVLNTRGDMPGDIPEAVAEFRTICAGIVDMLGRSRP